MRPQFRRRVSLLLLPLAVAFIVIGLVEGLWLLAVAALFVAIGQSLVLRQTSRQIRELRRRAPRPPAPVQGDPGPTVIGAPVPRRPGRRRPGSRR